MKRIIPFRVVVLGVICFTFVACSKLNNQNLDKVKTGMKKAEVEAILGRPNRSESGSVLGIEGTTYYYKSGNSEVQVVFVNDSVMSKAGSFK
jgi:outer membrane protein assembly factor BamE (lipoprotein component of BamABCDE complex)